MCCPPHLVRVLHAHAPDESHLAARVVHVGHDGPRHGREAVPVVRARVVAPIDGWCAETGESRGAWEWLGDCCVGEYAGKEDCWGVVAGVL